MHTTPLYIYKMEKKNKDYDKVCNQLIKIRVSSKILNQYLSITWPDNKWKPTSLSYIKYDNTTMNNKLWHIHSLRIKP